MTRALTTAERILDEHGQTGYETPTGEITVLSRWTEECPRCEGSGFANGRYGNYKIRCQCWTGRLSRQGWETIPCVDIMRWLGY